MINVHKDIYLILNTGQVQFEGVLDLDLYM